MKIRLETEKGDLVAMDWITPFPNELPRVIIWGERVFAWHGDGEIVGGTPMHNTRTVPVYREAFAFAIPQPQMWRQQSIGLMSRGSYPEHTYK